MIIENIREFIKEKANQFGAKIDNEFNNPYIERNNTGPEALNDNGGYFGFSSARGGNIRTISRLFLDNFSQ